MNQGSPNGAVGLEDTLRDSWAKLLEVPSAEVVDSSHFFESGGDSLLAVELVVSLSELLGVLVPLDSVMSDGTFGGLRQTCAELLRAGHDGG